jgi:hypothetical protein
MAKGEIQNDSAEDKPERNADGEVQPVHASAPQRSVREIEELALPELFLLARIPVPDGSEITTDA